MMRKFGLAYGKIPVEYINGEWISKVEHVYTSEVVTDRRQAVSMFHYLLDLNNNIKVN